MIEFFLASLVLGAVLGAIIGFTAGMVRLVQWVLWPLANDIVGGIADGIREANAKAKK